jgi:hypothetical protein
MVLMPHFVLMTHVKTVEFVLILMEALCVTLLINLAFGEERIPTKLFHIVLKEFARTEVNVKKTKIDLGMKI